MTVTEMEERVARAICVADEVPPEKECYGMGVQKPKDWIGPAWEARLKQARAAIRVMQAPTTEMLTCGYAAGYAADDGVDEVTEVLAEVVYTAMIRAASPGDK